MCEAIQQISSKVVNHNSADESKPRTHISNKIDKPGIQSLEGPTETFVFEQEISPYPIMGNQEPVYNVDSFGSISTIKKAETVLTPPPNFNEQISHFPEKITAAFKEILNADIVGIWPIKTEVLLKK